MPTATWIVDGQPTERIAIEVVEQGRRVHGWQLIHDLLVNVQPNFYGYWRRAIEAAQRDRAEGAA